MQPGTQAFYVGNLVSLSDRVKAVKVRHLAFMLQNDREVYAVLDEANADVIAKFRAAGVTVDTVRAAEPARLQESIGPLVAKFASIIGEDFVEGSCAVPGWPDGRPGVSGSSQDGAAMAGTM